MRKQLSLAILLAGLLSTSAAAADCKPKDFQVVDYNNMDSFSQLAYLDSLSDTEFKQFIHHGTANIPYMGMKFTGDFDVKGWHELKRKISVDLTQTSQQTVLHNSWSSLGLAAYTACLNVPLTLTAAPTVVEETEFFIKLAWKPRPNAVGKISHDVSGGRVLTSLPSEIGPQEELAIKVARDKNTAFQLAINVSGIVETFELPPIPKKVEVRTKTFERVTTDNTTVTRDYTPTSGFEFVPATLQISQTMGRCVPYGQEPPCHKDMISWDATVKNEHALRIVMRSYRTANVSIEGLFDVSIKEIRTSGP